MKIKQIGVMGSCGNLGYSQKTADLAFSIGKEIAKNGYILIFGAEKDCDSLSANAARGAKSIGGLTVGVTYRNTSDIWGNMEKYTDIIIPTGMERGGGREFILVNSCDAIIAVGGGGGTLNEIVVAYQKNIPIVVMKGTGGWSDKLADTYLDERYKISGYQRKICKGATTPQEAMIYLNSFNTL